MASEQETKDASQSITTSDGVDCAGAKMETETQNSKTETKTDAPAEENGVGSKADDDKASTATAGAVPSEDTSEIKDKSSAAADTEKDEESMIASVVERLRFFFSDANVRQDMFMQKLLLKDEGIVPIESMLKFNTIRQHTTDPKIIVKALQSKELSDRIVLTDDSLGIKRVKPFTLEAMEDHIPLTLLVGNLPTKIKDEGKEFYTVKVDEVRKLFEQYGRVALVKLRYGRKDAKNPDSDIYSPKKKHTRGPAPRGSALVEFEDEETLKKAADDVLTKKDGSDIEPKRTLQLGDNKLSVLLLKDVIEELKKRPVEEEDDDEPEEADGNSDKKKKGDENKDKKGTVFKLDWKPGCVIKLEGLSPSCDREALFDFVGKSLGGKEMEELREKMKIYVDFQRGESHGAIRFPEPDETVQTILQKLQSDDVEIAGQKVETVRLLEGEEEQKYWADFIDFKTKQKRQWEMSYKHGGRGGRHRKKQRRN